MAKPQMASVSQSPGVFQWLSSVAAKGGHSARLHIGVTAQTVRGALWAEGEDPERWALFCASGRGWPRLGALYEQILLLALAAVA